jgi:hypothetical protein
MGTSLSLEPVGNMYVWIAHFEMQIKPLVENKVPRKVPASRREKVRSREKIRSFTLCTLYRILQGD